MVLKTTNERTTAVLWPASLKISKRGSTCDQTPVESHARQDISGLQGDLYQLAFEVHIESTLIDCVHAAANLRKVKVHPKKSLLRDGNEVDQIYHLRNGIDMS
jgi:hypothetical protein